MTPTERAFDRWWVEEYGSGCTKDETDFYLRIFEAGWKAGLDDEDKK